MLSGSVARSNSKCSDLLVPGMGHIGWEGSIPVGPSEHSFHDLKVRDLDSQREGGIPCGRNGVNQEAGMRLKTERAQVRVPDK
jgi:hypothetical protein